MYGTTIGFIKGDIRSLDYGSCGIGLGSRVHGYDAWVGTKQPA